MSVNASSSLELAPFPIFSAGGSGARKLILVRGCALVPSPQQGAVLSINVDWIDPLAGPIMRQLTFTMYEFDYLHSDAVPLWLEIAPNTDVNLSTQLTNPGTYCYSYAFLDLP